MAYVTLHSFQWEGKVDKGQEDFEKLSKTIRREVIRFESHRVTDFKDSVVRYLQALMENQQKVKCICLYVISL